MSPVGPLQTKAGEALRGALRSLFPTKDGGRRRRKRQLPDDHFVAETNGS